MAVGPIQVIVIGFDRTDQFKGEVLDELAGFRGRGLIRLIDLFVAAKSGEGNIVALQANDLSAEESAEFGSVVSKLLGLPGLTARDVAAAAVDRTMAAASASLGLDYHGLRQTVENLQPGRAFAVLLFEHTWAIPLAAAIRRAGGVPLAQGFVTPEALVMVGEEINAIAEAADAIELSGIVRGAAVLDILTTLQEADAVKTAIAADVLRTLVVAELIEEAAVEEAIATLAAAGLMEAKYLDAAVQTEEHEASETKEFFASAA